MTPNEEKERPESEKVAQEFALLVYPIQQRWQIQNKPDY